MMYLLVNTYEFGHLPGLTTGDNLKPRAWFRHGASHIDPPRNTSDWHGQPLLVYATTSLGMQGMKEKVDSLLAAGELLVVDHELMKVAYHNLVRGEFVATACVVNNLDRGSAAP